LLAIGPLFGRYPGDTYVGDMADNIRERQSWAVRTCNFAELCYSLRTTSPKAKWFLVFFHFLSQAATPKEGERSSLRFFFQGLSDWVSCILPGG
jgi:hypothetical protein